MDELCPDDTPIDTNTRRSLRAALPASLRTLYSAVLAETLLNGNPVSPTALVVVLSAHYESGEAPLQFTSDHISELLWFIIHEFCEDRGFVVPDDCAAALHAALKAASEADSLSGGSDTPSDLFRALEGLQAS